MPSAAAKIPVYRGEFGPEQAERLLWRAGFGPRRGQAEALARKGLNESVRALTAPGRQRFVGPRPKDEKGRPLAPRDAWGHDHLWWLDRMVRGNRPLMERMTLVWHDWFATSNEGVGSQGLMLRQNALFRRYWLGSFRQLTLAVTRDPAMLLWLSGTDNTKWSPNENYARELMELFTLGAGRGYTERDVREQARALTGFRNDWREGVGPTRFRFDRERHDLGSKRIFGRRGRFDWRDAVELCVKHPRHPSFFVSKLWGYFIPTAPPAATRRGARAALRAKRLQRVRPVVARDPQAPAPLRRPADGEAAGRLHRGAPSRLGPRSRHRVVDVALRERGPAALLPAERVGLERRPLARHGDLPGPVGHRRTGHANRGSSTRTRCRRRSTPTSCSTARSRSGATRRSPPARAASSAATPTARSGPPTRTGSGGATRRSSRTPSAT